MFLVTRPSLAGSLSMSTVRVSTFMCSPGTGQSVGALLKIRAFDCNIVTVVRDLNWGAGRRRDEKSAR